MRWTRFIGTAGEIKRVYYAYYAFESVPAQPCEFLSIVEIVNRYIGGVFARCLQAFKRVKITASGPVLHTTGSANSYERILRTSTRLWGWSECSHRI